MDHEGSHLSALIDLAKEPSSDKRRALLRDITGVFMTHADTISATELAHYDHILSQLTKDMETAVRSEIALTLSNTQNAPKGILRMLMLDDIAVAGPILQSSNALSEDDLFEVVTTQGQAHLQSVSKRKVVSQSISNVIVKRADDDTLKTLLSNDGANLSRESHEIAIERAKINPALHEVVVTRREMPKDLVAEMYFVVEARLREQIIKDTANLNAEQLDALLEKSRQKVAVAYGSYPADYQKISQEVEGLRRAKRLDPLTLARFMRDKNPSYFLCALAQLADIDYLTAKQLNERCEVDAIAIAFKAAGIEKALFLTYVMMVTDPLDNAMGKAKVYGELYSNLPLETATRTIRFWKLRRSEGRTEPPSAA